MCEEVAAVSVMRSKYVHKADEYDESSEHQGSAQSKTFAGKEHTHMGRRGSERNSVEATKESDTKG